MADGEWRERRRGGERGRYLHARREQGVGVGGGTPTRRGIGQEVPISIFLAARTQHRGVIVAARRTQCCTQASRRAGVPDRGEIQGPGSLSPPKCFPALQLVVVVVRYLPPSSAGSAVQYLGTGTDGCSSKAGKAPHKLTDTDTHPHTARQKWSVRRVPVHDARVSSIETVTYKLISRESFFSSSPGTSVR